VHLLIVSHRSNAAGGFPMAQTTTPITAAQQDAHNLAVEILAGKYDASGPWLTTANFQPREWRDAASWAVDAGDYDDLFFMMAQERRWERAA